MSLIVLQTACGETYEQMLKVTEACHRKWCEMHNYTYRSFVGIKRGVHPWHASFNRFYMLNEVIQEGTYDWALYMDVDCVVVDLAKSMQDLLDPKYAIIACSGGGHDWEINAGIFLLNLRHPQAPEIISLCIKVYEATTMEQLKAEKADSFNFVNETKAGYRVNDQMILQGILYAKSLISPVVKTYSGKERDMFNYATSRRIVQLLREYFKNVGDELRVSMLAHTAELVLEKGACPNAVDCLKKKFFIS